MLRYVRNRMVREVFKDLRERLKSEDLLPDEYFELSFGITDGDREFPRYRGLACYPVTGSSEGHYIHVDALVLREDLHPAVLECVPVFLGKTFQGFDFAARVAAACAKYLGA
ncbi:MAG: hypothetical protein H0Z39_02460 [Peptococcaceae bacterium]|nr:hypothetical protein [Peptococcaceae bacterium]